MFFNQVQGFKLPQGTKQARQASNGMKENILPTPLPIVRVPMSPKSQFLAQELDGRFSRRFKKSISWIDKEMYRSVSVEPCPWNNNLSNQIRTSIQRDRSQQLGAIRYPLKSKQNGSRSEGASPVPKRINRDKADTRLRLGGNLPAIKSQHNTPNMTSRSNRRSNINILLEDKNTPADFLKPIKKRNYAVLPFDLREDIHINTLDRKSLCILAQ